MHTAVAALSWELLARSRWLLVLTGVWLAVLCLVGLSLPVSFRSTGMGWGLAVSLAPPLMFLLGSLSHGEGSLDSAASLFPRRLFTLPVPTVVLIGPPLLLGTVVLLVCWTACAVCLLRACGVDVPLWWPVLFGAAVLALLQAFAWSPFPLPYLRPAALTVLAAVFLVGAALLTPEERNAKANEPVLVLASAAALLAGYAGSLVGVARARRGAGEWATFQVGAVAVPARQEAPRPFSSPLRAQMYLERKRLVTFASLVVAAAVVGLTVGLMCLVDFMVRAGNGDAFPEALPWVRRPLEVLGPSWLVTACVPILPFLILSAMGGSELGRLKTDQNALVCSAFLATRPLRTAEMVKAKLVICAGGVTCLWAVMVLAGLGWAVSMGRVGEMADRLAGWTGSGLGGLAALLGVLALLAVLNWLALIRNLWLGALGRPLLEVAPIIADGMFPVVVVALSVAWRDSWWAVLGWVMSIALVGKALAAAWVVRRLRRERLVSDRTLARVIAGWVLLAGVVGCGALFLGGAFLAGGAVLFLLPLARPLAGPPALAHNRTR